MYNREVIERLVLKIKEQDGMVSKDALQSIIANEFGLVKDSKVYYCDDFAIRFSQSKDNTFGNTVLSLSSLQKYDNRPVIICLVKSTQNRLFLANTTFLKKISHSSHELRTNNIKGSFNGSDIVKMFGDIENNSDNFETLYAYHEEIGFDGNLERLVESTNQICGNDTRYKGNADLDNIILDSPRRAVDFVESIEYQDLKRDLQSRVEKVKNEIIIASLIENVNIRGRLIEYLVCQEESNSIWKEIVDALKSGKSTPTIKTDDDLGDFEKEYTLYSTKTDIKTKVLYFNSAPKAYNIDKLLKFLSLEKSVYMIYFIGINENEKIDTFLCSLFQSQLLKGTSIQFHWAGRNSRGVSQFSGSIIEKVLEHKTNNIDIEESKNWLNKLLKL